MSSRSSVLAAAATLLTFDEKLTRQSIETKIKTFASGVFETVSVVFILYLYFKITSLLDYILVLYVDELNLELSPNGILMQQEDVFRCYTQMQELSLNRTKLTPVHCIGADVDANSSFTPVISTKRKRLEFDDCDQDNVMSSGKKRQ